MVTDMGMPEALAGSGEAGGRGPGRIKGEDGGPTLGHTIERPTSFPQTNRLTEGPKGAGRGRGGGGRV